MNDVEVYLVYTGTTLILVTLDLEEAESWVNNQSCTYYDVWKNGEKIL